MQPFSSKHMTNFLEDTRLLSEDQKIRSTVYSSAAGLQCTNGKNCCSERRLLTLLEYEAKGDGCKGSRIGQWIRRKTGGVIKVWRYTADGRYGNSFPCKICRKSIMNYHLKVLCTTGPEDWFEGYLTDDNKNISKLTTGQALYFKGVAKFPLNMRFHCK